MSVLERMARRLAAGEQTQSRRELLVGRHDPPDSEVADARTTPVPEDEAARNHGHPASAADKQVMRTALDHVTPTRDAALTLVEALRDPTSAGTFNSSANKAIRGLRSDLAGAHKRVAAISTHSALRAKVLDFLTNLDAVMATLQAVGQSTDPARAARLRTRARKQQRRVASLERAISPALTVKSGS